MWLHLGHCGATAKSVATRERERRLRDIRPPGGPADRRGHGRLSPELMRSATGREEQMAWPYLRDFLLRRRRCRNRSATPRMTAKIQATTMTTRKSSPAVSTRERVPARSGERTNDDCARFESESERPEGRLRRNRVPRATSPPLHRRANPSGKCWKSQRAAQTELSAVKWLPSGRGRIPSIRSGQGGPAGQRSALRSTIPTLVG